MMLPSVELDLAQVVDILGQLETIQVLELLAEDHEEMGDPKDDLIAVTLLACIKEIKAIEAGCPDVPFEVLVGSEE